MISTVLFICSLIVICIATFFSFIMAFAAETSNVRGSMAVATLLNATVLVYLIFFSVPI